MTYFEQTGFNVVKTDLVELGKTRGSEALLIVGNGPSAEFISATLGQDVHRTDIVGFSLALFSNLKMTHYFHEPVYLVPHSAPRFNSSFEYTQNIVLYHLLRQMCNVLDRSKELSAICNPHFPKDNYGYWNMPDKKLLLPDYYFINELDDKTIVNELRMYTRKAPITRLLNFRGSMIRALSLGYLLGYKKIIVAGFDPSSPNCWYSNDNSSLFDSSLNPKIRDDIRKLSFARMRSRNEFDTRNCFYNLPRSVIYSIKVLDSILRKNHMDIPKISFITSCKRTKDLLLESKIMNRLDSFFEYS